MGLTANSATGSQTTTQSPQAAVTGSASSSVQTGDVQPGTASSLLAGQTGLALHTTPLSTVSLGSGTQQAAAPSAQAAPVQHHHTNVVLIGLAVGLLLVAVVFSWVFSRQVKSTTI